MRAEKQLLLDEIKEKIDASNGMIVASYTNLTPNKSWEFRDRLAKAGGLFEVVRKRVFLKAAEQSGVKLNESLLAGHVGVVFFKDDAMAPAKTLVKFSEENENAMTVVYGQIEGVIYEGADVVKLAKLPGINELRSELIGLLVSPMTHMLSVLDAAMAGPLSVIEQKSQE